MLIKINHNNFTIHCGKNSLELVSNKTNSKDSNKLHILKDGVYQYPLGLSKVIFTIIDDKIVEYKRFYLDGSKYLEIICGDSYYKLLRVYNKDKTVRKEIKNPSLKDIIPIW